MGNKGKGIKGQWVTITLVKWTILSVILVFLRDYSSIQLLLLTPLLFFSQCLIIITKPNPVPLENHMSLFNEIMTSIYLYILYTLTDYTGRNEVKVECGNVLLGVVLFTIAANLIKVLVQVCRGIKCKKKVSPSTNVVKLNPTAITSFTDHSISDDFVAEQFSVPKKVVRTPATVSKPVKLNHKVVRY
ncbi:hypothetical protein FGO68_gene8492 [Halteria grandinella]|uniref:Uncharacterized protein n=1 Tax=Halteria grandinella TaxID=5974 RepID=A0A8J8T974_HALGN|nr:hypothetical protein FGO68_gene8492 [Halteria grandinella]